jgi:hypothetical protein
MVKLSFSSSSSESVLFRRSFTASVYIIQSETDHYSPVFPHNHGVQSISKPRNYWLLFLCFKDPEIDPFENVLTFILFESDGYLILTLEMQLRGLTDTPTGCTWATSSRDSAPRHLQAISGRYVNCEFVVWFRGKLPNFVKALRSLRQLTRGTGVPHGLLIVSHLRFLARQGKPCLVRRIIKLRKGPYSNWRGVPYR